MKKIEAVLFDFDGVLADTMNDNFLAWKKAFANFGVNIKKKEYYLLEGLKVNDVAKLLSKQHNAIDLSFFRIVNLKNRYYLENHSLCFYSEIPEIIKMLKEQNKLIAIVSASPKQKLKRTVPKDFLDIFNSVISGDDYSKGKPDPEPYLTAMRKLKIKPYECVVVENAPLGIKSAKSAGAYCIAITTTLSKKYLKEADRIVRNHKELKEILRVCSF